MPTDNYKLTDVAVTVADGVLRIGAQCGGPPGAQAWVRAWLSNEAGTLAETAINPVEAGSKVMVEVRIPKELDPNERYTAYIRIESSPLETRQVVSTRLDYKLLIPHE